MRNSKSVPLDSELEIELVADFKTLIAPAVFRSLAKTREIRIPDDQWHIDRLLKRFLRAENHDIKSALHRLEKHASWRETHIPNGNIPDSAVVSQIRQRKVFLQPCGKDGRPLLVIRVANHHVTRPAEELETFVMYSLEAAAAMCDHPGNPDGKLWALFDLGDVKWENMDSHALYSCFKLLNERYPERVVSIFNYNSPFIFDALWRMVKPFIDPVSRSKVQFVSGEAGVKTILSAVDPMIVPTKFGGMAQEVAVEAAVATLRESFVLSSEDGDILLDGSKDAAL